MGRAGLTPHTLVHRCGTAGHTLTVSELDSLTRLPPDGASVLATDMDTIPTTIRGGGRWDITDAAGIHTTGGERGVALLSQTYTACGETRLIHVLVLPGRIHIQATMVLRRAAPIRIRRRAGLRWQDEATTPISIRETRQDIAAVPHTIQTRASLLAAVLVTQATFTPAKALRAVEVLFITPTPTQALLPA